MRNGSLLQAASMSQQQLIKLTTINPNIALLEALEKQKIGLSSPTPFRNADGTPICLLANEPFTQTGGKGTTGLSYPVTPVAAPSSEINGLTHLTQTNNAIAEF